MKWFQWRESYTVQWKQRSIRVDSFGSHQDVIADKTVVFFGAQNQIRTVFNFYAVKRRSKRNVRHNLKKCRVAIGFFFVTHRAFWESLFTILRHTHSPNPLSSVVKSHLALIHKIHAEYLTNNKKLNILVWKWIENDSLNCFYVPCAWWCGFFLLANVISLNVLTNFVENNLNKFAASKHSCFWIIPVVR